MPLWSGTGILLTSAWPRLGSVLENTVIEAWRRWVEEHQRGRVRTDGMR
jgi:hypothetical protein